MLPAGCALGRGPGTLAGLQGSVPCLSQVNSYSQGQTCRLLPRSIGEKPWSHLHQESPFISIKSQGLKGQCRCLFRMCVSVIKDLGFTCLGCETIL
ncbi:rCG59847 [Rattus norvegicus]|uniref:RCG59847 n=1 Tax=Rattus norvegicus TaxID=10116 RepID=A6HR85_RAT|nr:rCG59847 [Rattus norvegicus]